MPAQQVFSTEFPLMWGMGIIQSFVVATGSTHTMPSYHALNFAVATDSTHTMPSSHALNFAWGEHKMELIQVQVRVKAMERKDWGLTKLVLTYLAQVYIIVFLGLLERKDHEYES